jgi:hypothetical protein
MARHSTLVVSKRNADVPGSVKSEQLSLLAPIERHAGPDDPLEGKVWRMGAIKDRALDAGAQEGQGRAGANIGIRMTGVAGDFG